LLWAKGVESTICSSWLHVVNKHQLSTLHSCGIFLLWVAVLNYIYC
jgi:hypothetical protein